MEDKLDVFLCHASEDKPNVRRLHRKLVESGFNPWLDEEDLDGGVEWEATIQKAVRASHIVAVCLSKNSITKTGFVQKEIRIALDAAEYRPEGAVYLLPVRLEECQIPSRLSKWHAVDIYEKDGYRKLEKSLTKAYVTICLDAQDTSKSKASVRIAELHDIVTSKTWEALQSNFKHFVRALDNFRARQDSESLEALCLYSRPLTSAFMDHAAWERDYNQNTFNLIVDAFEEIESLLVTVPPSTPHFECIIRRAKYVREFDLNDLLDGISHSTGDTAE